MNIPSISQYSINLVIGVLGGGLLVEFVKRNRSPVQQDQIAIAKAAAEDLRQKNLQETQVKMMEIYRQTENDSRSDSRESLRIALETLNSNVINLQKQIEIHQAQITSQTKEIAEHKRETHLLHEQIEKLSEQIDTKREERHELLIQLQAVELLKATESQRADFLETKLRTCEQSLAAMTYELEALKTLLKEKDTP